MFDKIIHKWLRVPYALNVRYNQRPKKARATVLFIHGIGHTGDAWERVVKRMPSDVRIITIDLLGFGESPRPKWAIYDAKTQARAVLATFLKLRIRTPVVIVGHSLGALVSIEVTKRYPIIVKSLVLCSPPFYDLTVKRRPSLPRNGRTLRRIYRLAQRHPDQFVRLSAFAMKYKLINESFHVTADNIDSYMSALESMIINQTSLADAHKLKVPTKILRGTLDPLVIPANLKKLAASNPHVTVSNVIAGHEIQGRFIPAVISAINEQACNEY